LIVDTCPIVIVIDIVVTLYEKKIDIKERSIL